MSNLTHSTDASQITDNHDDNGNKYHALELTSAHYAELLAFYHCAMCLLQQLNHTEQHDPMMRYLLNNTEQYANKIAAWLIDNRNDNLISYNSLSY